jgi:hypothetical protein
MFEERLFGVVDTLHKVADMFTAEGIPHEVIGGMAVAAQIEQVDQDLVMLTKDVDVMIQRSDLERAAPRHGFTSVMRQDWACFCTAPGRRRYEGYTWFSAVRRSKADQAPNPPIAPERIEIYGKDVSIVSVVDLVRMKLNSYRDKDRVHAVRWMPPD